jgi:flagellar biosynthesis/type III secretory pathway protein FliH
VDEFDKKAVTPLDEWISFLKTGEIPSKVKAKGLSEARERLRVDRLSASERRQYDAHMEALRYQRSVIQTNLIEGKAEGLAEGIEKGRAEGRAEGRVEGLAEGLEKGQIDGERSKALSIAGKALQKGMTIADIMDLTGLKKEEIEGIKF